MIAAYRPLYAGSDFRLQATPFVELGQTVVSLSVFGGATVLWRSVIGLYDPDDFQNALNAVSSVLSIPEHEAEERLINVLGPVRQKHPPGGTVDAGFLSGILNSADFAKSNYRRDWLVTGVLVRGEPAILGGPKKSLKTSLALDLAVSLGTGTNFLNHFAVPGRLRTLVLSGESGPATIQETAFRICESRQTNLDTADILWGFSLPRLDDAKDLDRLTEYLRQQAVQVVIIDPAYLCLISAGVNISTSNLFQVGPLLRSIGQACRDAETTPVLLHHSRKQGFGRSPANEPLDLDELSQSGFAEWARQWILVNPREAYDPELGRSRLWLGYGGSAGHGGLMGLDITQGRLNDQFGGRRWVTETLTIDQIKLRKTSERETKVDKQHELQSQSEGLTYSDMCGEGIGSKEFVREALDYLSDTGEVRAIQIIKPNGKGKRDYPGYIAINHYPMYILNRSREAARSEEESSTQATETAKGRAGPKKK
jgi:hypothetical protein